MNKTEHTLMRILKISWALSWRLALINFSAVIITLVIIVLSGNIFDIPRDNMKTYANVVGFVLPFITSIFITIIIIKKRYLNFSIYMQSHTDSGIQELLCNIIVSIWWNIYWRIFVYIMICTACVIAFVMLVAFIYNPGTRVVTVLTPILLIPLILVMIFLVYSRALNLRYPDTEV